MQSSESMTRDAAEEYAQRIYNFWADQGFSKVKVWAERDHQFNANNQYAWVVRSDLVGGIPAGYDLNHAVSKIAQGKTCEQR